jgi:uncharacterized delta-60 repeat protein
MDPDAMTPTQGSAMSRPHRIFFAALSLLLLAAAAAAARTSGPLELDTGFGRHGVVSPGHSVPGFEEVGALAVAPGRHIWVAGESIDSPGSLVLGAYGHDGDFDTSFGDHGYLPLPIAGPANALLADGNRVFILTQRTTITRLRGGQIDPSFGSGGSVRMDQLGPELQSLHLWSIASLGRGSVTAAGISFGHPQMVAIRLLPDGSLDPSFNGSGSAVVTFGQGTNSGATQVKLTADGKVILGGYADGRPALARLLANGDLDRSFGRNGKVVAPLWLHGRITALTVRRDGSILAGASGWTHAGTGGRALLLRYGPKGTLDRHFGAAAFSGSRSNPKATPITVMRSRHYIFMATRGKGPSIRAFRLDGRPIRLGTVPGVPEDRWFHIDAAPQDRDLILAYTPQHAPGEGLVEIKRFGLD